MVKINNIKNYIKTILESAKYWKKETFFVLIVEWFHHFQSIFTIIIISQIILSIEQWNIENIYYWTYVFIILFIFKIIEWLFSWPVRSNLHHKFKFWLSKYYLKKYINLDNNKVEEFWTWKMNNIIFKWIDWIIRTYEQFLSLFIEVIAIIFIFIIIYNNVPNIYYFIWFISLFLLIIYLLYRWILKIVEIRKKVKEIDILISWKEVKILMSKFEIFQNWKINQELNNIEELYEKSRKLWFWWIIKKNIWQNWSTVITEWLYITTFLIIWIWVITENYNIAQFTLLIWLLTYLGRYAWQIRYYIWNILNTYIDVEKLIDTINNINSYDNDDDLPDLIIKKWDIEYKWIWFSYNWKKEILNNFNLYLEWWKKYAFVGESWWWKSTLLKLLSKYIRTDYWDILLDWQCINKVNRNSYYKNIWYLTQEPSVFDWTIIENLLYWLKDIPDEEEINNIIKKAKCEFIYDLKDWINTHIWEKWIKLSWWQKQRIAIAKIMIKNPNIIILDEPTSALDSFNEEQVSIALDNLFKNKTVIIVAHRLQTVKKSDCIFYIEKWKIIEKWTHDQLLKINWKYSKMIELQTWF